MLAGAPAAQASDDAGTAGGGTTRRKPPFRWSGKADSVQISPHEDGKPDHYRAIIRIRNGRSQIDRKGQKSQKSDHQIHTMLLRNNGAPMDGRTSLMIGDGIYMMHNSTHDPDTGLWNLDLQRYGGEAPKVAAEGFTPQFIQQDLTGCGCGCFDSCYICRDDATHAKIKVVCAFSHENVKC